MSSLGIILDEVGKELGIGFIASRTVIALDVLSKTNSKELDNTLKRYLQDAIELCNVISNGCNIISGKTSKTNFESIIACNRVSRMFLEMRKSDVSYDTIDEKIGKIRDILQKILRNPPITEDELGEAKDFFKDLTMIELNRIEKIMQNIRKPPI